MTHIDIHQASFDDLNFILSLAKEEGWNPGNCDAVPFYSTDPNGFFIAEADGKKVGCISTVAYSPDYGFLGLYIVIPEYRKKGVGIQLWDHAMRYMGNRCMGLDGVVSQQENYQKSGFKFYYKNIRFEGGSCSLNPMDLLNLRNLPFEKIQAYDYPIFGIPRPNFLKQWITMPNAYGLAKVIHGHLRGYGILRSCAVGYKVGPLFADTYEIAEEIYQGLCALAGKKPVFLDVPETNLYAMQLAKNNKLQKVFETARMYTRLPPRPQIDKTYGITTFELG